MKKTLIINLMVIFTMMVMILIAGCDKKTPDKDNNARSEGLFAYEKRVLLDMIDILERYNSRIFNADTPEKIAEATEEFCDKYEVLKPEIIFVTGEHPDWEGNPPEEVDSIIKRYMNANRDFLTFSLDIIKNNADNYPDNERLGQSYERLEYLTTPRDTDKDKNTGGAPETDKE